MEDRIEVGEYVKTKDGRIAQIKSIDYEAVIYRFDRIIYINNFRMKKDVLYSNEMFKKVIVKHSKQLIDLTKIGDIVNGHLVIDKYEDVDEYGNDFWCLIIEDDSLLNRSIREEDIKTILTKEQYEANYYKVGGEDESN